jgi:shikimate kinase
MNRHAQNRSRNILFIGMPCSGKTSFGKNYAFRTGRQFVDFELYVERYAGKSLKEIAASEGEAGFRERMARCLRRLDKRRGTVIAIGGGVLFNPEQFRFARSLGLMVWLQTPVEILAKRVFEERQLRPLFSSLASVEQTAMTLVDLLEKRQRYYECADVWMETTHSSVDNLALQMLAIERRAHSLVQRRETPPFLHGGWPFVAPTSMDEGADEGTEGSDESALLATEGDVSSAETEQASAEQAGAAAVVLAELQPEETWGDVIWRETINSPIEKSPRREQGGGGRASGQQGAGGGSQTGEGGGKRRRKRRGRGAGDEGGAERRPHAAAEPRGEGQSHPPRDTAQQPRPEGRRDGRPDGRNEQRRDHRPNNRTDARHEHRRENRGEGRPDGRRDNRGDGRSDQRRDNPSGPRSGQDSRQRRDNRSEGRPEGRPPERREPPAD